MTSSLLLIDTRTVQKARDIVTMIYIVKEVTQETEY